MFDCILEIRVENLNLSCKRNARRMESIRKFGPLGDHPAQS